VFAGHDRPSATAIIPELPPQDSITPEADKSQRELRDQHDEYRLMISSTVGDHARP